MFYQCNNCSFISGTKLRERTGFTEFFYQWQILMMIWNEEGKGEWILTLGAFLKPRIKQFLIFAHA